MHEEDAEGDQSLMDFNTMQQASLTAQPEVIPLANHTYDLFFVQSHSASGNFRLHRSDFGMLQNPRFTQHGAGFSANTEGDGGEKSAKVGAGLGAWYSQNYSGPWKTGIDDLDRFAFRGLSVEGVASNDVVTEPCTTVVEAGTASVSTTPVASAEPRLVRVRL